MPKMKTHRDLTPGPWALCRDSNYNKRRGFIRSVAAADVPGAMADDGSRPAIAQICESTHSADTIRANTRLIEAAPLLLNVCEEIFAALNAGSSLSRDDVYKFRDQLAQALRSATGRIRETLC